ncbi:MAG: hypothetical protein ACXVX0_16085 [Blastococcus sp.]
MMLAANPGLSHSDVRRILTVTGAALTPDPGKPGARSWTRARPCDRRRSAPRAASRCSPAVRTRPSGTSGRPPTTTAGRTGRRRAAGSTCWTSAATPSEGSPAVTDRGAAGTRRENQRDTNRRPLVRIAPSTARVTRVGKALRIGRTPMYDLS